MTEPNAIPDVAGLNLPPSLAERVAHAAFVRNDADPAFRLHLARLSDRWREYNAMFFSGRMAAPHLSVGRTAPRRFSQCRRLTNYGGEIDITLSEAIVFGTNTGVVRNGDPALGFRRFLDDLLLAETVKQYVMEVLGASEEEYGGYGPRYAAEATRVGAMLGLSTVARRRRGRAGPVVASWPYGFRPEGYYLGDVVLAGRRVTGPRPRPAASAVTIYEYLLRLANAGELTRLRDILARLVDTDRLATVPGLAADERGPDPAPEFRPEWVRWNDSCPARIAEFIADRRAFEAMPVLADALQDAGCDDAAVRDHCQRPGPHTADCWVLKAIRAAAVEPPPAPEADGGWPGADPAVA